MITRRYLVLGGALTDDLAPLVAATVAQVWWRHGALLTSDDHGICAEVARCALIDGVPCQVAGVNRKPTNGARGYLRLLVDDRLPRATRLTLRDQFLVQMADYVIIIGEHPAYAYAQRCGKKYLYKKAVRQVSPTAPLLIPPLAVV